MQNLPFILAALACPLGMGAMMFFMMRPGKQQNQPGGRQQDQEIAQLRAQVAELREQQRQTSDETGSRQWTISPPASPGPADRRW